MVGAGLVNDGGAGVGLLRIGGIVRSSLHDIYAIVGGGKGTSLNLDATWEAYVECTIQRLILVGVPRTMRHSSPFGRISTGHVSARLGRVGDWRTAARPKAIPQSQNSRCRCRPFCRPERPITAQSPSPPPKEHAHGHGDRWTARYPRPLRACDNAPIGCSSRDWVTWLWLDTPGRTPCPGAFP